MGEHCSHRVHTGEPWDISGHWCTKKPKVEVDGKWYCAFHDPERVAARQKAKADDRAAKRAAQDASLAALTAEAERLGVPDLPGKPFWADHDAPYSYLQITIENLAKLTRIESGGEAG